MFESLEQPSRKQKIRSLIRSYLHFKDDKKMQGLTQKQSIMASQKYVDDATLEAQIKQFYCQQIQNQSNIKLYENILCRYNPHKKAQFLCSSKYCDNHAIICGKQTCKCTLDHRKCTFIPIEPFLDQIASKRQQPIPKQIQVYFQAKSVIYEHMVNRISQERQALIDWQNDINNESALFVYGFKNYKAIVCHAPKVAYKQKMNRQKCCAPLQIRKDDIKEGKEQIIKTVCKNIHKKYSSMINYFDQKTVQLQYHKEYANLNSAQLLFIDFLKNMNIYTNESEEKKNDQAQSLKDMKIVTGRAIYIARKYSKKQFQNLDFEKFSINRLRKIWKRYSERIFRLFVEGKAINELYLKFCQMNNLGSFFKIFSVQELRYQIDKIIQSISQGQKCLFSKSILIKKLALVNLQQEQLRAKLKSYEGKEVNEVYISNNRENLILDFIETTKELGNLIKVRKLEIKWCGQMPRQFSIEILNRMPHLNYLALIGFCKQLPNDFTKKLCQFKQLAQFHINQYNNPDYFRSYCQDSEFIGMEARNQSCILAIEQLVELSKLPKLENITINQNKETKTEQVIRNMKKLRHISLENLYQQLIQVSSVLLKQIGNHNSLRTLSLVAIKGDIKQINSIICNNPHLNTIIITSQQQNDKIIDDGTIECMTNLIQLQNLVIQYNPVITGNHFSNLDSLKMLSINYCNGIHQSLIKYAITKMKKLQSLCLNLNDWVDDEVIVGVQSCRQLKCLNIYGTNVSGEIINSLVGLNHLSILICGSTKINGKILIELTKHVPSIKRLDISFLEINENELLQISANCQELTHLNTIGTEITAEILLQIKQLKVVFSTLDQGSKMKLRKAGVKCI